MTPTQIGVGVIGVALFISGAWLGRMAVTSDWNASKAQDARDIVKQQDRNAERRAAADEALSKVQSAVTAALRRPSVTASPIKCPASGNALDAPVPGLRHRLLSIDAGASGTTATNLEILP